MMNCITPGALTENLDTRDVSNASSGYIRTVLEYAVSEDSPGKRSKSANTLWLLRYKPEDIPVLEG